MPLRNEHDLVNCDGRKILASMSHVAREVVDSTPDDISDGDTYAKLSKYTSRQWGYDTCRFFWRVNPNWGESWGERWNGDGDETDDEIPVLIKEGYERYDWSCKLCAKMGIKKQLYYSLGHAQHMKRM